LGARSFFLKFFEDFSAKQTFAKKISKSDKFKNIDKQNVLDKFISQCQANWCWTKGQENKSGEFFWY
jgi:hypothetical protein